MSVELLRKAADLIEQRAADLATYADRTRNDEEFDAPLLVDDDPPEVWAWHQTFRPQVAAPLVAWLRAAADADDSYRGLDGALGRMIRIPDLSPAYRHTADFVDRATAFARVILGEDAS